MPRQPQQSQGNSIVEKYQIAQGLMNFMALPVMIWLRRDLGYRTVSPIRLIPVTGILLVVSVLASPGNPDARPGDLLIFAVVTFVLGVYQCVRRWIEMEKKIRRHSFYIGTSPFEFRWLPEIFLRSRRPARFMDPLCCMLIGYAVSHVSHLVGMFLVFSGFCLGSCEHCVHLKQQTLTLDIIDGMIHSEHQSQTVEEFEASSGWHRPKNTEGLPSGLGEDIEREITISVKQRKVKTNKNTINI
jgi:hypothetical protein